MRFGVALETFTPPGKSPDPSKIYAMSTLAERLGFDSLWVWDHLLLGSRNVFPVLDSLSTLASLSAKTSRIYLGTSVLIMALRNPIALAKVLSTIQFMSNGRLIVGTASGWYEREFRAAGVGFASRGRTFESRFELVRKLLSGSDVNYDRDGFLLHHASMEPRHENRIPMLIGGYSDRVLERAGRLSDGWISYYYPPAAYAESWAKVEKSATSSGKDASSLRRVNIVPLSIASTYAEADRLVRKFTSEYMDLPKNTACTVESSIRGPVGDCIAQVRRYESAGVEELVFIPCGYEPDLLEVAAREIMPAFQ